MSDEENIEIEFWEDKNGFCPVDSFLNDRGKLTERIYKQIIKKIDHVISGQTFDSLLKDKDRLTILSEYKGNKITPRPYELKFKSQSVRIISYRKGNILILVEAVKGSFSNKKIFEKAMNTYQTRICQSN